MQLSKKLFRDLIILLFGLAGIGWFFYSFPMHHPYTVVKINHDKDQIVEKADSVIQSWQFQSLDYHPSTELITSSQLIDSLQKKWGTEEFKQRVNNSRFLQQLPLLNWKVSEHSTQSENRGVEMSIGFNTSGKVVSFNAGNELISRQRPFNRQVVRAVFQNQVQNFTRGLEDSLITELLDYQHLINNNESNAQAIIHRFQQFRGGQDVEVYMNNHIWNLVNFYLERSAWKNFALKRDSVQLKDEGGFRFARTYVSTLDSTSGVSAQIIVDVLPAGSLKSMEYELLPEMEESNGKYSDILESMALFIVLVFAIWLLFVFYLRIKARAIDTKPAMIVAVLAGFMVPGFWVLQFINELGLMYGLSGATGVINSLMMLAVLGGISAVGFFVITAVSDSITRQYWPEKLKTWDLIRRGLFANKPVGWDIINAVAIGGILTGIVGVFLFVITPSYIPSSSTRFIADRYFLPSVANLMINTCMVLVLVVPVFLILANQIKGTLKRNWLIPVISAVLFGLIDVLHFNIEPDSLDRMMRIMIGFALGYFYLRYDILTIVFGYFVFVNFLTTANGWMIEGSPDANTFYLFVLVLVTFTALGVYFVLKGTDREELPEYVPEYIEEQAKEQRLKQELSIARVIQETFLPSKIHHLPGIDIAGVCIPAQETGGDYYDMISLGEHRTAIAIGDVSGKGIRASFYMTFTKGVLHSLSALILSPVELLNQLNRLFNENATRGTFISMIYGVLEADKRQFTFARAGHNPMLVVRENGDTEWLQPNGVGIGVSKGDEFIKYTEEAKLTLNEGDVIILYTDGITEMLNTGNHFYGEDRLERLVKGVRKASSEKILEIITEDVNDFKGMAKQHDDMTLVIIKADSSVNP